MKARICFSWSGWLIGIDWSDRIMREILGGWLVHIRLGPLVLQLRTKNEDDADDSN